MLVLSAFEVKIGVSTKIKLNLDDNITKENNTMGALDCIRRGRLLFSVLAVYATVGVMKQKM